MKTNRKPLFLRLPPDLIEHLDKYVEVHASEMGESAIKPSRTYVIELAILEFLKRSKEQSSQ